MSNNNTSYIVLFIYKEWLLHLLDAEELYMQQQRNQVNEIYHHINETER